MAVLAIDVAIDSIFLSICVYMYIVQTGRIDWMDQWIKLGHTQLISTRKVPDQVSYLISTL